MFKIGNDLIKAWIGYHEDDYEKELRTLTGGVDLEEEARAGWLETKAIQDIVNSSPKKRLEVYLEWNGITGYSNRVYDISIGKF